jgi:hypothetical protein
MAEEPAVTESPNFANDLDSLRAKWAQSFPSTSAFVEQLRESFLTAEAFARDSTAQLIDFRLTLQATELPLPEWDRPTLARLLVLERRQVAASRHSTACLQALQSAYANSRTGEPKSQALSAIQLPAVQPAPSRPCVVFEQVIEVRVVEGEVRTSISEGHDAAFWCSKNTWPHAAYYTRRFWFENKVVPECYAWVLTDEGVTYEPAENFAIDYSPSEFKRLCELELATHSEHLIDGERLDYERRDYASMDPDYPHFQIPERLSQ